MLTKRKGAKTWASLFPNVINILEDKEIMKDWRLGIHFRPLNVPEYNKAFIIKMEIPGLRMEDFNVEVKGNELIITAETTEFLTREADDFLQEELIRHYYKRAYKIPKEINSEQIDASFNNNVLTLVLPKREETLVTP